jgi:hypothetical protein
MERTKKISTLIVVLSLFLSFSIVNVGLNKVKADSGLPLLQVTPSNFSVQNASLPFSLNLTITNVTDLYGWQVRIYFENTILNFIGASEGPFLSSAGATYGLLLNVSNGFNATHGTVLLGDFLIGNVTGVDGSGVLATMNFQAVGGGNATLHINPYPDPDDDTILIDSTVYHPPPHKRIIYEATDAHVSVPVFNNIAVTNVLPWKTVIGQGYAGNISVTVADTGTADETFNLTVYGNSTPIMTQTVTLPNRTSTTITFAWNTSAFTKGPYNVSAYAQPVPNELNITDNTYVDGFIIVTFPGDISGNYWVQLADLVLLANAYGTTPASGGTPPALHAWNPNADINNNGVVDLSDLVILATHYGQKM